MNKCDQGKLEVRERKVPRKIYGGRTIEDLWERRNNNELKLLYTEASIQGTTSAMVGAYRGNGGWKNDKSGCKRKRTETKK